MPEYVLDSQYEADKRAIDSNHATAAAWTPMSFPRADSRPPRSDVACFSQCGRVGYVTVQFPPPVGPQMCCTFCASRCGPVEDVTEFFVGYRVDAPIFEDCPAEAVVSLILRFDLQWQTIDCAAGLKGSTSMTRITTTVGAHPLVRAATEHDHFKQTGHEIPLDPLQLSLGGFVSHRANCGDIELLRDGERNGLEHEEVTKRIGDELLDRPSDVRTASAYPEDVKESYKKLFDAAAKETKPPLPADRSVWFSAHDDVHESASIPVLQYCAKYPKKQCKSVLTDRVFTLDKSAANHSHTTGDLLSPLPMLDNLRLGCVDKDAIEKTHRICGCFDKQVYGQVVEELCAGAINYLRFPNPRLRDIYTAIAQNAEWSALVTRIARRSGNISQDIRTLHHLLVKGPLADLVEEYKRSINARKMDYNQMMNMVILAKP